MHRASKPNPELWEKKEQNLMKCFKIIPENRCVEVNDVPMILFEKNGPSQIEVDSC